MTDLPDREDDFVSAVIDGEATPAEAARVASDPVLRARLAALQAAVDAMATPVASPPADAREEAIASALAAFDDLHRVEPAERTAAQSESPPAAVVRIDRQRLRWLGLAAAAVVAVAFGALLLRASGGTKTTSTAAKASSSSTSAGQVTATGAEGAPLAGGAGTRDSAALTGGQAAISPAAPSTSATAASVLAASGDLGSFSSTDQLTAAVRARRASENQSTGPPPTNAPPSGCGQPTELRSVELVLRATLSDRAVLVVVGPSASAGNTVYVALDSSCAVIVTQDLS